MRRLPFDNLQSLYEFCGWVVGVNGLFECQWTKQVKGKTTEQRGKRGKGRKWRIDKNHPHLLRQPNLIRSCLISSMASVPVKVSVREFSTNLGVGVQSLRVSERISKLHPFHHGRIWTSMYRSMSKAEFEFWMPTNTNKPNSFKINAQDSVPVRS